MHRLQVRALAAAIFPPATADPEIALATGISIALSQKEENEVNIDNPALAREIQSVQQQAKLLTDKAEDLPRISHPKAIAKFRKLTASRFDPGVNSCCQTTVCC